MLKRHIWLLLGLLFLFIFTATPLIWTAIHTPENSAWVPINDQYKLCGDDKVYGAMVHEQKENFFNFRNPVSKEIGTYGVSIFRELSLKLTLFLGLFLENLRLFFAISFVLGVLVSFSLMYSVVYAFVGSSFISATATWLTFLYFRIFSPAFDLSLFSENILNSQGNIFFEFYNDHFRYVALHSAYILFWPMIFAMARYKTMPSLRWMTLLSLSFAGLVYSYQPLAIIGSLVMLFWLILLSANKEFQIIKKVLIAAGVALLLVTCFGFWGHLNLFLNSPSEALTQHFASAPQPFFVALKTIFINQHVITLFVLALLTKANRRLQQLLWSMFATAILLKCLKFNPNYVVMVDRIFHRGFDTFWLLMTAASLLWIFNQTKAGRYLFTSKSTTSFVFIALIIPNLICSQRMASSLEQQASYFIPKNQWDTYEYIAKNTPKKAVIIALDFRDNQLLPVYTSANLFFSMPFGSTIKVEFNKFLMSWKYLGYERSILEGWMEGYIDSYSKFRCAPTRHRPSLEESFPYLTVTNIIYDPYILNYGEIQIRNKGMTKFNDLFLKEVFRDYDRADETAIINSVDYILVTKHMPGRLNHKPLEKNTFFKVEYENDHHILLKNIKIL